MLRVFSLCLALCTPAPVWATCPAATDMSKGVVVKTLSPRGEHNTFTFRKTGPGRVDEIRTSQWIAVNNTVQRQLFQGLFPAFQKVLKSPENSQVLKDETYSYPGQNLAALELKPNTEITLTAMTEAEDGFRKDTITRYTLGRVKTQRIAGCMIKVMIITGTEDWDGIETIHTYKFFPQLGFGIETETKYPGKTYDRKITSLTAAKR